MKTYGRRDVLGKLGMAGAGLALVRPGEAWGQPPRRADRTAFRHDLERVRSVVGSSHSNLERVRELVLEQPALAKASWDWGFGDWESALGAASHTGRREIAEFLLAHGARPTLFSSAMLGEVDVVRALVETRPEVARVPGPHGISLMRHALAGGDEAALVVEYLSDRFGPDTVDFGIEGSDELEARFGGRYVEPSDPEVILTVRGGGRWLMIGAGETASSRVLRAGADTFHPTGAPSVRMRFEVVDGRAEALTLVDGPDRWRLVRS